MTINARRIYVWTHRTLGFAFGAFFLVVGITGALLVYRSNVDVLFDPVPYQVSGATVAFGADAAVAIAHRAIGQGRASESRLRELSLAHITEL